MPTSPLSLDGRRALVTGGTRGIGAATASLLAESGARVVVSARSRPDDHPLPVIVADLGQPAQVQRLADETLERLGGIDVLVSNVGGQIRRSGVFDFTDDDWEQELAINLLAAVRLDRALVPRMVEQGHGAVVHVSSGAARVARPQSLPYSASKAALNAYSKGLAREVGPSGVRVNVISPGFLRTSRLPEIAAEQNVDVNVLVDRITASSDIPLGRAGTAQDAARLIRFLVSDEASYLTGSAFAVDGGAFPTV